MFMQHCLQCYIVVLSVQSKHSKGRCLAKPTCRDVSEWAILIAVILLLSGTVTGMA